MIDLQKHTIFYIQGVLCDVKNVNLFHFEQNFKKKHIDIERLKILNNKLERISGLIQNFLNQHDENFQKEIKNDMKTFLNFQEKREFILNLSREKGMKICDFSLLNLNSKKYVLEVRGIVQKNNFFTEDIEEFPFARISCGDFTVGEEGN